mgnify:CR=1 FL=1
MQEADAIYREEIAKAGLEHGLGQYFAGLTNMRSVGVMGDFRTYDYAVALHLNLLYSLLGAAPDCPHRIIGCASGYFPYSSSIVPGGFEVKSKGVCFWDFPKSDIAILG